VQLKQIESHSSLISLHELIFIISHISSLLSHCFQQLSQLLFVLQALWDRDYLFMTFQSGFLDISAKLI